MLVADSAEFTITDYELPITDYPTMFWNRKAKNRRLGREYVLDVKLRSSQVSAARARKFVVMGAIVFTVALSGYLLWRIGGWTMDRLVYENQAFSIREIDWNIMKYI